MTGSPRSREDAALLFLDYLVEESRNRAINSTRSTLERGPTGRAKPKDLVALHEWYTHLAGEDREMVLEAVRRAANSAVFGILVLLDDCSGGMVRDGTALHFSLTLELRAADAPECAPADVAIGVNPRGVAVEDLHDMYWQVLARRSESVG